MRQFLFTVSLKGVPVIRGASGAREQVSLKTGAEQGRLPRKGSPLPVWIPPTWTLRTATQLTPVTAAGSPAGLCVCVCACSVVSDSLRSHELQPSRFLCLWDSPGQKTGVGGHFLLQEMRAGLCLTPLGSPRQGLTQGRGSAAVQVNSVRHCLDNPVLVNMKFAYTPRQTLA